MFDRYLLYHTKNYKGTKTPMTFSILAHELYHTKN